MTSSSEIERRARELIAHAYDVRSMIAKDEVSVDLMHVAIESEWLGRYLLGEGESVRKK